MKPGFCTFPTDTRNGGAVTGGNKMGEVVEKLRVGFRKKLAP